MSDPTQPQVPPLPPLPRPAGPAANPAPASPAPDFPAAGQPAYAPPAARAPFAAPYAYPGGARPLEDSPLPGPARTSPTLGVVALVAALVAAVATPVIASIAGFAVGSGAGREIALRPRDVDFDWSVLSAVREWVLLGEVSFWVGTALGVWGLVQGIVAIATGRGRPQGIAATVIAALGPVLFAIALQVSVTAGLAAGSSIAG